MPSIIFFLISIVALIRAIAAAEATWEASPRAFALTKGKPAAANSGTSTTLYASGVKTFQYTIASTPDGTIYTSDASNIYYYVSSSGSASMATITSVTPSLASNGNTLYWIDTAKTSINYCPVTLAQTKPAFVAPSCASITSYITFTALTSPVGLFYAPGFLTPAKGPKLAKAAKGAPGATDAFLVVSGSGNLVTVFSAATSGAVSSVMTMAGSGATCNFPYVSFIGGIATSGNVAYISTYASIGTPGASYIYKVTASATTCTIASPVLAGNANTASTTAAGVYNTGSFKLASGVLSMSLALSGSTLYVSDAYGIATVDIGSGSIGGNIVGSDTIASGSIAEGTGAASTWFQPSALLIPPGKTGGTLIATDYVSGTGYVLRSVTWAGAAKVKVGPKRE